MIPLTRDRRATVVGENFRGAKRLEFNLELMQERRADLNDPDNKQKFKTSRWKPAKEQLLAETHDKCAYCEAPTAVVAYGDVEHYRPKSKYWWLAYCYENYLASCQLCNQAFKKAKFSIDHRKMRSPVTVKRNSTDSFLAARVAQLTPDTLTAAEVTAFESAHEAERPFLPNPYVEDPAQWFAWEADDVLRRVTLVPRAGVPKARWYVRTAERDLGLNRIELQELRYAEYDKFRTFKMVLADAGVSPGTLTAVRRVVKDMLADSAPFTGMLRYFEQTL